LTLIFALMIGLTVLAAGLFMAELLKSSHIESLKESMLRELRLLQASVDWNRQDGENELMLYYGAVTRELKRSAGLRVTYIRGDGKVLGDSDLDAATMDNHAMRREIVEARAKGVGYAIRFSGRAKYAVCGGADQPGGTIERISAAVDASRRN
jgi:two-component system phosphate regulon sensor histidine kinase PhoR